MVGMSEDDHVADMSSLSPRKRFSHSDISGEQMAAPSNYQQYTVVDGVLRMHELPSGTTGAALLLHAIRENGHILELDLTGCNISKGDDLAEAIESAPNLRRLVLEWNNLGSAKTGIAALTSAIGASRTIKELDLRSNRIGPTTAAALALALRNNSSLTSLDLRWNEIGPSGATALIGMLERNRAITDINLSGNSIPSSLQTQIDRYLERNRGGASDKEYSGSYSYRRASETARGNLDNFVEGRHAHLQFDLSKLRTNLDKLKEECQSLRCQQESTNSELEAVKTELHEENRLRVFVQKEGQEFKEQAIKAREDILALEQRLQCEISTHNNIVREARDMHAQAVSQCQALQTEILRLREEHSSELRDLAERARKEADYNISLMNKMDNTLHEHDQMCHDEMNKLCSRLAEEVKLKENALRETEKFRDMAKCQEMKYMHEKDAHEQALKNLSALNSELECLQCEMDKLTKQLAKTKKLHAVEIEELERNALCHKQMAIQAEEHSHELEAERAKMMETLRLLEDKNKVLEKKLELERLHCTERLEKELQKADEDRRALERELQDAKQAAKLSQQQLQEMLAEQDQRRMDCDRKVQDAESAIINVVRQQLGDLRAAPGSPRRQKFY